MSSALRKSLLGSVFKLLGLEDPHVNPDKYFFCCTLTQHPFGFILTLIPASPSLLSLISPSVLHIPSALSFFAAFKHFVSLSESNVSVFLPQICTKTMVYYEPNLDCHGKRRKTLANIDIWNSVNH